LPAAGGAAAYLKKNYLVSFAVVIGPSRGVGIVFRGGARMIEILERSF
jgi:hypothetical protein